MTKKLIALVQLLDAVSNAKQFELSKIVQEEEHLKEQLGRLETAQVSDDLTPARLSGADLSYERWREGRRKTINLELATILARKDRARREASKAVGRFEVSKSLLKRARP